MLTFQIESRPSCHTLQSSKAVMCQQVARQNIKEKEEMNKDLHFSFHSIPKEREQEFRCMLVTRAAPDDNDMFSASLDLQSLPSKGFQSSTSCCVLGGTARGTKLVVECELINTGGIMRYWIPGRHVLLVICLIVENI